VGPAATGRDVVARRAGQDRVAPELSGVVTGRSHRPELLPALLIAAAVASSALVLLFGATVLWLSLTVGIPGDADSALTLSNYVALVSDRLSYAILANTLIFSGIALVIALGLGVAIAFLCERTDIPGKPVVFTLMSVSLILPNFAVALGWVFLLNPQIGLLNGALMSLLGLREAPFNIASLTGMGFVEGLNLVPVAFVMSAAALKSMDPVLEEAASMSAATALGTFRRITLPVLAPAILGVTIYIFTLSFTAFDVPAVIGLSRRIFTFSTYIYSMLDQTVETPKYGFVAALSVTMIAFGAVLGWYYNRVQRQGRKYAVISGKAFRPRILPLGRARGPAIAAIACYFIAAQLLPLLVLAWAACLPYLQMPSAASIAQLSTSNLFRGIDFRFFGALGNTALLMLLVPTITVALSLAISWVVLRSNIRYRSVFDIFAFMPHTIPAVVFSVSALFVALFVLQGIVPIYGTIWLLVMVYAVSRLGYGTRMTNSALVQINRELEEAGAASGAGFARTMRAIVLPLMRPTILYSWIWIALLSYRELTLPILLAGRDNQPLSVVVWGYLQTSSYGPASAITLVMLALLSPMIALYWIAARRAGLLAGARARPAER
jgi:iron(III) transport system permease protein